MTQLSAMKAQAKFHVHRHLFSETNQFSSSAFHIQHEQVSVPTLNQTPAGKEIFEEWGLYFVNKQWNKDRKSVIPFVCVCVCVCENI